VGRFAERDRPGWNEELADLIAAIEAMPPKPTLDVACGTGFLTRHLGGEITGLDQSARMLKAAQARMPNAMFVRGDALALPFPDGSFERVFTGHFYGHLREEERVRFLEEARRIAPELVVVDASNQHVSVDEEIQDRILNDGSCWEVYKRYFTPEKLADELGGGEELFCGHWFVAVRA
jgi:ubiquinone/menaquinone biosynthesis C-methylase UbiE